MHIIDLISSGGFITLNKAIVKKYGLYAALMIGEIASLEDYFSKSGQLDDDGMFYAISEHIEKDTSLTRHKQNQGLNVLEKNKLIITKLKGVPAKKYYKINTHEFTSLILKNLQPVLQNFLKQDFKKFEGNKNISNKNINNNIYSQKKLFPENEPLKTEPKKEKKLRQKKLFCDSEYNDFEIFKRDLFLKFENQDIDIDFENYYKKMKAWSSAKNRKSFNWASEAEMWIYSDLEKKSNTTVGDELSEVQKLNQYLNG